MRTPWPWQTEEDMKENITGIWAWDPETGKMVRVSDRIPNTCVFDCSCPEGGYWSHNMDTKPVFVESRSHKRKLLKERGLKETG